MVTTAYKLEQINDGYQDMLDGKNIRGVIRYTDADRCRSMGIRQRQQRRVREWVSQAPSRFPTSWPAERPYPRSMLLPGRLLGGLSEHLAGDNLAVGASHRVGEGVLGHPDASRRADQRRARAHGNAGTDRRPSQDQTDRSSSAVHAADCGCQRASTRPFRRPECEPFRDLRPIGSHQACIAPHCCGRGDNGPGGQTRTRGPIHPPTCMTGSVSARSATRCSGTW